MLLITAVVMTPHCRGGDGVPGGASFVIFTAEQIVITLIYGVGADSSLHTATSLLNEGTFHWHTATVRTGIVGFVSKKSALLEGVVTACRATLITVRTVFILVGR